MPKQGKVVKPQKSDQNVVKSPQDSTVKRAVAITMKEFGHPYRKIIKELKISPNTLNKWWAQYQKGEEDTVVMDVIQKARSIIIGSDLELLNLTNKRIKRTLKDKNSKVSVKELTQLYEVMRDGVVPSSSHTQGQTPPIAIQINNSDKAFSIDKK